MYKTLVNGIYIGGISMKSLQTYDLITTGKLKFY